MIELTGNNVVLVGIVAVIGLAALVVAGILVREVLAADEGTERMKEIGAAVQEGAAAYLNRQFKTLSIFAVVVFFLLFLLPTPCFLQLTLSSIGLANLLPTLPTP